MKQRLRAVLAVSGFAFAAVAFLALAARGSRIDREHFDAVREAMTRDEVERALGGPPRNECREPVDVWVRGEGGELRSAELAPTGPAVRFFPSADPAPGGDEAVWVGEAGLIAVRFGDDGRVREKHFSTVHRPGRPSPRRFVAHWFE